jgi:chromosome segregation ATPase
LPVHDTATGGISRSHLAKIPGRPGIEVLGEGSNTVFLEQVTINGFKSYPAEAVVNFKPGIAVIVGNNGAGKSNILDAITWVLGEDNPARLRAGSFEDLLFCGTKDYPSVDRARVTLLLREGTGSDARKTEITRTIDRDGGGSCLIDGKEHDVSSYLSELAALGLRDAARTLIRQEKINEIIGLSPRERAWYVRSLLGGLETLSAVERDWQKFLRVLVPEATANLSLVGGSGSEELVLEASLGKKVRNVASLSGGERSVCSLALNLALFAQLSSPFYLLDEVEAALDWTNHKNMQGLLKVLMREKQLIMITHLRSTIQLADSLHGIRARKDGSSFVKYYFEMNERLLRAYKCC